jgi:uncharacterized protein YqeY
MSAIREALQRDLKVAMKARDRVRISALRGALSAVANAEAVEVTAHSSTPVVGFSTEVDRRELSESDVRSILERERDELLVTAAQVGEHGREAEADELRAQAEVLTAYV